MALTHKLGIVADAWPDPNGQPDLKKREAADTKLFRVIRNSGKFPISKGVKLLDIGSGWDGSPFVNRYEKEFPNVEVVYLDFMQSSIDKLNKPNKLCANATQMPFPDESFDMAYTSGVITEGILKNHWDSKDESYRIVKETYRILKQGGLFIFTYCMGDDRQTLANLSEIGFGELEHLQRIKWFQGIPTDTYFARKLNSNKK